MNAIIERIVNGIIKESAILANEEPHVKAVESALMEYRSRNVNGYEDADWDDAMAEYLRNDTQRAHRVCRYTRTYAETWVLLEKARHDVEDGGLDFDGFIDAINDYNESFPK